jgi:hypothetical protein
MYSLAMISDSACSGRLQLWPLLSSAVDIVRKPRPSAYVPASPVGDELPVVSGAPPVS